MNFAILFRSLGTMVLLLGAAMIMCVLLGLIVPIDANHNPDLVLTDWAISLAITLAVGVGFRLGGAWLAKKKTGSSTMRRREAMALVGIGWVVCSLIAAVPYVFCNLGLDYSSAIFEAVSGLTTTGATIFDELEGLPKTILLWRSVTQWVGGMGILAMFVVVLSGSGVSGKTLIGAESSLSNSDLSSIRQTMRQLWVLYFSLTVVGGIGLYLMGLSPFQAVNHILTTISTGGFGTQSDSIMGDHFTTLVKSWMIFFMIIGGLSFPIYLALIKRQTKEIRVRYEEVWWYLGLLFIVCVTMSILAHIGYFEESTINVVFNVVSVSTSTGYASSDYELWGDMGIGVMLVLMIIGGCSGSTAGGLKVSRIVLWFRCVRTGLKQSFRPRAILPVKLNGRAVEASSLAQLLLVISLFGFFGITGSILFRILEHQHSPLGTLSLIISLLGNTGPAFGEMGPTEAWFDLSAPSKFLCSGLMILGRLEYTAVLILFSRSLWKRY